MSVMKVAASPPTPRGITQFPESAARKWIMGRTRHNCSNTPNGARDIIKDIFPFVHCV